MEHFLWKVKQRSKLKRITAPNVTIVNFFHMGKFIKVSRLIKLCFVGCCVTTKTDKQKWTKIVKTYLYSKCHLPYF